MTGTEIQIPFQTLQVQLQIFHSLVTFVAILLQRLAHDAFELEGRVRLVLRKSRRFSFENCGACIAGGLALERRITADHLVDQYAETPDVCTRVDFQTPSLFWRHVGSGADDYTRLSLQDCLGRRIRIDFTFAPSFSEFCESEVEHLDDAIATQHDVFGFNVAMNYSRGVCH